MTTALAPARVEVTVDLDTRLAIADAAMTLRLEQAQLQFDVNTAHIPNHPVVDLTVVDLPAVAPQPAPTISPLAAVFRGAVEVIRERGWIRDGLRDEQGAVCLVGAIRAAAHNRGQADEACAVLLDAIQAEFTEAQTVPSWNDAQTGPGLPLRFLHQAATAAARI